MTAYDEVAYDCQPIPCTAPEQLAVTSLLHGGPRPPLRDALVLEIGCGDGANLLPLAYHRPQCRFVGVDASRVQIEDARASTRRLGLTNIELHGGDVTRIGDRLGTFDYILAHGVMSWVPEPARDEILALCRAKLAARGLLYLSYNTYPGWLVRGLVRDIMCGVSGEGKPLRQRAGEAVARADALRLTLQRFDHPYAHLLNRELARLHEVGESYLIHEYLAEHNRPYWFREFASLAAGFGFHYLAEAAFTQPEYRVPPAISERAASLASDALEIEGLIDILWYRQHRASLFCRADEASPRRAGELEPESFTVASGLRAVPDSVSLEPEVPVEFAAYFEPEVRFELSDPVVKAVLVALAPHWPRGLPWERLLEEITQLLRENRRPEPWAALRELHALGQVELRLIDLAAPRQTGEMPQASPLTRWEAERRAIVTTATHHRLGLTENDRKVISRLDGRARGEALAGAEECIARLAAWGLLV